MRFLVYGFGRGTRKVSAKSIREASAKVKTWEPPGEYVIVPRGMELVREVEHGEDVDEAFVIAGSAGNY